MNKIASRTTVKLFLWKGIHKMDRTYAKTTIFFGIALLLCLLLFSFLQADNLYGSVIRIHVLANSDSKEDQEKKFLVRDALLEYASENLGDFKTQAEAEASLREKLCDFQTEAKRVLNENGCQSAVEVSLGEEYYSTRHYSGFSLPAGHYLSLQVKIGEAKGQNWWCVLFPPLCLSSSINTEDALLTAGMTKENTKTVTCDGEEYEIRFRVLEWFGSAKERIRSIFS